MITLNLGPAQSEKRFVFDSLDHRNFKTNMSTIGAKPDKIGVYFSGGLDSTALLCLILSDLKNQNLLDKVPVFCFGIVKRVSTKKYAIDLIEKIEKHFDYKIEQVQDIPNNCDEYMMNNLGSLAMMHVKSHAKDMILYAAINRPPDNDINPELNKSKPVIDYGKLEVTNFYIAPFLHLHKFHIVDIFYKLGCEWLIPYTHSCWNLEEGRCGECFACRERAWGFQMLEKDSSL